MFESAKRLAFEALRSISTVTPLMVEPAGMLNPKLEARRRCEVLPFAGGATLADVPVVSPWKLVGLDQAVVPPSLLLAAVPANDGPAVGIYNRRP